MQTDLTTAVVTLKIRPLDPVITYEMIYDRVRDLFLDIPDLELVKLWVTCNVVPDPAEADARERGYLHHPGRAG